MTQELLYLIEEIGFPIAIAIILLWDKLKSNGHLKKTVENNSKLLQEVKLLIERGFRK